jgi:8-oxo-dGTP pyrophosphatase MutT (NUDIX family)
MRELRRGIDAAPAGSRDVVAVVLTWRSRVGLFKRSQAVAHDAGLWHCVTGYLEDTDPLACALREIHEETGLTVSDLGELRTGPVLSLAGRRGSAWIVHTFIADTTRRRLSLNWEHVDHRWVKPRDLPRFDGQVSWLSQVLSAVDIGVSSTSCPSSTASSSSVRNTCAS